MSCCPANSCRTRVTDQRVRISPRARLSTLLPSGSLASRSAPRSRSASSKSSAPTAIRSWKLEAGSWKLEAGSWKLEAGSACGPAPKHLQALSALTSSFQLQASSCFSPASPAAYGRDRFDSGAVRGRCALIRGRIVRAVMQRGRFQAADGWHTPCTGKGTAICRSLRHEPQRT